MAIIAIVVGITVAVISLVVYSALIISNQQARLANRLREENRFIQAPFTTGHFAFETAEELTIENETREY